MTLPSITPKYVESQLRHYCVEVKRVFAQSAAQRNQVLAAQANAFFNEKRYFDAAQRYAQCSTSFEEVALKFLDAGERDGLRAYLISRLERTRKTVSCPIFDTNDMP